MATAAPVDYVAQVGDMAGVVWNVLAENGRLSMTQLTKKLGQPRDTVMQAIGWLAREDKIVIEDEGRTRVIALR